MNHTINLSQKVSDAFLCKRSGGLHTEAKVHRTCACGRANRRNRRCLYSLVHERGLSHWNGNAKMEELCSNIEGERDTTESS